METLREVLPRYSQVRIGTQKGSGFLYCGPADEEALTQISRGEHAKARMMMADLMETLTDLPPRARTGLQQCVLSEISQIRSMTVKEIASGKEAKLEGKAFSDDVARTMKKYIGTVQKTVKEVLRCAERLTPWIDILDRKVIEAYPSVAEEGVHIIIVAGVEYGRYWTVAEYVGEHLEDDGR